MGQIAVVVVSIRKMGLVFSKNVLYTESSRDKWTICVFALSLIRSEKSAQQLRATALWWTRATDNYSPAVNLIDMFSVD